MYADILHELHTSAAPSPCLRADASRLRVLQSGKPLVAVKRSLHYEIIRGRTAEDRALGECGILIESGSPQELARALQVLIGDKQLAREMGKIASRRFEQYYSHSIHLNSFLSLYKNYL